MRILGTHHCDKELCEAFKLQSKHHDVLWQHDYSDWIVSIFDRQIKSEYYCDNSSVPIEVIALDNFSA